MTIGLYFGSFNPIHNGHLAIAQYMYENYHFDAVCFVVSPANPLKNNAILLNEHKRLELVRIAIEDKNYMLASDIEFDMEKPSYTYLTLRKICSEFPKNSYSLILGSDNIEDIFCWKNYEEILDNYKIFIYPRKENGKEISQKNIIYTHPPLLDISSTMIRERIKKGETIRDLVPPKVAEVIEKENLYL
jgi:nicotinate-nucleotide adenylyltransferase